MSSYADRLKALREQLKADRLDGFVVPLTDEHMSEYVGSYAQRLAWLTGFQGSAGSAVVLPQEAAIFVDGRYTLQVRSQVDGKDWSYQSVPETSAAEWLKEHAPQGGRIGYDPWLHSRDWVKKATEGPRRARRRAGRGRAKPDRQGLVGSPGGIEGAPDRPAGPICRSLVGRQAPRDCRLAGETGGGCRRALRARFDRLGIQCSRSGRVPDPGSAGVRAGPVGRNRRSLREPGEGQRRSPPASRQWRQVARPRRVRIGAGRTARDKRSQSIRSGPSRPFSRRSTRRERRSSLSATPPILAKAIKNPVEIAGQKSAQERDGAAISRFLRWVEVEAPSGEIDELTASDHLEALRRKSGELRDLSFDTISGAGPNGAIVHYKSSEKTNRKLEKGTLYLVDSRRTVSSTGRRTSRARSRSANRREEMRDRFTRVLKGHIAVATAIFPKGTRGSQLDSFARRPLWEAGLDYAHGTGHGVGSFLSVHEGPQRISPVGSAQSGGDEPLQCGHDPFERARVLQDWRIRHPHREFGAGRRQAGRGRGEGNARLRDADLRADRAAA